MRKLIIILLVIVILVGLFLAYYYLVLRKPDLVITNVTSSEDPSDPLSCEYHVEIENKGRTLIDDLFYLCWWPEGLERCNSGGAANYDWTTDKMVPLNPGEKYISKFFSSCLPKSTKLHFEVDPQDALGTPGNLIKESNEKNNYFLFIQQHETLPQETPISEIKSEEEIANWKIYQNKEFGFEIKYPPNFQVDEIGFQQNVRGLEEYPYNVAFGEGENPRDYILAIYEAKQSASEWSKSFDALGNIITTVKVGDFEGKKIIGKDQRGNNAAFFYITNNKNTFILATDKTSQGEIKYFNNMVSTFKFLE